MGDNLENGFEAEDGGHGEVNFFQNLHLLAVWVLERVLEGQSASRKDDERDDDGIKQFVSTDRVESLP